MSTIRTLIGCALLSAMAGTAAAESVIRLKPRDDPGESVGTGEPRSAVVAPGDTRRGFDYQSFGSRLETLWFQRKAFLADGRTADVERQDERIRTFCAEEGVSGLEGVTGALITEAQRAIRDGRYQQAHEAIELAAVFDPDGPQVRLARADWLWRSGRGKFLAAAEGLRGLRASFESSVRDLSLINRLAVVAVVGLVACLIVFAVFAMVRHQKTFRHEVEEWVEHWANHRWAGALGWAALLLPFVSWVGAGWAVFYWILVTFRFMRRTERLAAVLLLGGCLLVSPAYRLAVAVYGMSADPVVRTTVAAASGEFDPRRVVELQELVEAHPDNTTYRFLLAGLYKNGRYLEAAFDEYKRIAEREPALEQARINIGNIFYATGQYAEAIANYHTALAIRPGSVLALFNLHLAQSEAFRFQEAEESLRQARAIDSAELARLFGESRGAGDRPTVIDARLGATPIWTAALAGSRPEPTLGGASSRATATRSSFVTPLGVAALITLVGCALAALSTAGRQAPARRCIRCGAAFCRHCKRQRDGQEYCSQCHHLFVAGDGLAPETKTRKFYEVERYGRLSRTAQRVVGLVLPGARQILRGRALRGTLLIFAWLAAWIALQPAVLRPVETVTGFRVGLELLQPHGVPAAYDVDGFVLLAACVLVVVWVCGNGWRLRRREA